MIRMLALAAMLIAGCGSQPAPSDAGIDAGEDAGRDAGPPDGGPTCSPECPTGAACCGTPEAPVCATLGTDLHHCGECGIDCEADARGSECRAGQCACGDFDLGCLGQFTSFCCAADPMRDPYCANLAQDRTDCGACGNVCDATQGNQCEGGRCVCGDSRDACAGTPESTCCTDAFENFACVDTTTDRNHCGTCGNRCLTGLRCVAGDCVP